MKRGGSTEAHSITSFYVARVCVFTRLYFYVESRESGDEETRYEMDYNSLKSFK